MAINIRTLNLDKLPLNSTIFGLLKETAGRKNRVKKWLDAVATR